MLLVVYQHLPVTAVKLTGDWLFAAEGGKIKVFHVNKSSKDAFKTVTAFKKSVIHGFQDFKFCGKSYITAHGGKEICSLEITEDTKDDLSLTVVVDNRHEFDDWILDIACISTSFNQMNLAVALAHNSVVLYDWCRNQILKEVHCVEKCILYSAHFVTHKCDNVWDNLVLCAGTVFNQIVLWKPCSKANEEQRVDVLERICGHNGVIFDISYDTTFDLLFSASDDRSIRVWRCPALGKSFTHNFATDHSKTICLGVMYGHEARVWNMKCYVKDKEKYVVSIAEDGLCIIWKLMFCKDELTSTVVKKTDFHANLLSLSLDDTGKYAIGGFDGSVRVFNFDLHLLPIHSRSVFEFDKETWGVAKTIKLLTRNGFACLVHTDTGCLLLHKGNHWQLLQQNTEYGSYAIMTVDGMEKYVAIGNTKGSIKVLQLKDDHTIFSTAELSEFNNKVLSITWYQDYLFASGPDGTVNIYTVRVVNGELSVKQCVSFTLPQAKHRWHTATLILSFEPIQLICGDRRGSIHHFVEGTSNPVNTCHGVHGKLGVTSLQQAGRLIISTGRDGHWRQWRVDDELRLLRKHRTAQGMEWLEGSCLIDHKTYIYGFHGNKFLVWSKQSRDELFSVLCGGGHRSWDFSPVQSKFVFLKAGRLNIVDIPYPILSESIINYSLHSQQINFVCHLMCMEHDNESTHILATSGEDTKVILSACITKTTTKESMLKVLQVIDDHLSNVRAMDTLTIAEKDSCKQVMLFTVGGRASLNIYMITVWKNTELENSCDVDHLASFERNISLSVEMRFMSIAAWENDENGECMVVGCSDGKLRRLARTDTNSIEIINESEEYQNCFLTVKKMKNIIVGGSTDGNLYLMQTQMKKIASYKCHQSGINAIACCSLILQKITYYFFATGGDDNAINLMLCCCDTNIRNVSSFKISSAHSGQITGLHLEHLESELTLVSTSIDQRLIRWCIMISSDFSITCEQISCTLIQVADVSGMDVYRGNYFICGQGLSLCITMTENCPMR
ncbi:tRNA (34-2'-O)-methyltransferase regulator WDR6-like isoform X1 [Clavelina lepadiformis]|uniref:tRNA (34-2'-O)-methyltransferase regulator WDR6-like isoform X1 n=2 Tax=Clavelina lepadiformis TaxID=159417 RepID=UPI00404267AC